MIPTSDIFYYYLYSILFFLFNYFIGHSIFWAISLKIQSKSSTLDILSKTLTGTILNVIVFSLLITKGISYSLAAVPILIFLFYYLKNHTDLIQKNRYSFFDFSNVSLKEIGYISSVFIFILLVRSIDFINLDYDFLIGGGNDSTYLFYTRIIDYMLITGEENPNTAANLINPNYNGSSIYHYYELWLGALHNFLFHSVSSFSFKISVHSLFLILMYCAYCILLEHFIGKLKFYHYLLIIPFLFSSSIYSNLIIALNDKLPNYSIFHFIFGNEAIAFIRHKVAIVELVLLTSIILFLKKRTQIAFCFLLYFASSYTVIAPAVLSAIFIFAFLYLFIKEKPSFLPKPTLLLCILVPLIIFILSALNTSTATVTLEKESFIERVSISKIIQFLGITITQQPLLYLPFSVFFVIIVFAFRKKIPTSLKIAISFFFLLFVCGSFFGSLIDDFNWRQFYNGIAYPLSKIAFTFGCFVIAFFILDRRKQYNRFWIAFSLLILLTTSWLFFRTFRNMQLATNKPIPAYSVDFLKKISQNLDYKSINEPTIGVFLLEKTKFEEECKMSSDGYTHANMINQATLLSEMKNTTDFFNLSWADIEVEEGNYFVKSYVKNSIFVQFMNQQKAKATFVSVEDSKVDFINQYAIRYLIAEKNVVMSKSLENKIQKRIVDEKTGLQFCILKVAI
jgi:hypothetical protein